jgi:hypothetical protein
MAFSLPLSQQLTKARWKVKIFDKESPREEPHVTVVRGMRKWRVNLRTREFMDVNPKKRDVPDGVIEAIFANWDQLRQEWDRIHPINPVEGADDDNT